MGCELWMVGTKVSPCALALKVSVIELLQQSAYFGAG